MFLKFQKWQLSLYLIILRFKSIRPKLYHVSIHHWFVFSGKHCRLCNSTGWLIVKLNQTTENNSSSAKVREIFGLILLTLRWPITWIYFHNIHFLYYFSGERTWKFQATEFTTNWNPIQGHGLNSDWGRSCHSSPVWGFGTSNLQFKCKTSAKEPWVVHVSLIKDQSHCKKYDKSGTCCRRGSVIWPFWTSSSMHKMI